MLSKLQQFLDGKKTYIIMLLVGIGAVLQYQGIIIPEYVWAILAAGGLGAVRSAVNKVEKPSV